MLYTLLFRSDGTAEIVSAQYDNASKIYTWWLTRPNNVVIQLDSDVETATIDIDSNQRMWLASDGQQEMNVRWSDPPYEVWNEPITLDGSITPDDMGVVFAMPDHQVGILWSNQSSKRFYFASHGDGQSPNLGSWIIEKVPFFSSGSCSSNSMADDHINVAVGSDGTLFAAVKTSFDQAGCPKISLLIRDPGGTWEMHEVDESGTRPIVLLNEAFNILWVIYSSTEGGGDILYKESATSPISFPSRKTLISGMFNDATSTKQNFSSEIVVLASDASWIVGVYGSTFGYSPNLSTVGQGSVSSDPAGAVYPP